MSINLSFVQKLAITFTVHTEMYERKKKEINTYVQYDIFAYNSTITLYFVTINASVIT